MEYGYCGKYLRVNLSTGEIKEEYFSKEVLRKYIGGSGLGAKIICEETDETTDPLGPDNVLTFFTGPLVGTAAPNFGRYQASAKSPLTNSFGEGNSGGTWGTIIKHAGVDGIIFNGASLKPVYLFIEDGIASLKNAENLWGMDTFETDARLKETHGKKTASLIIGPAGENLVRMACIINDGTDARAIGRCGLGAVMGSKKLKAVSVVGTGRPNVADQDKLKDSVSKWAKVINTNMEVMGKYGTSCGLEGSENIGDLPVKNWKDGNFDISDLTGQVQAEKILTKRYFCGQCVIGCGRTVQIKEGKYAGIEQGGPEFETIGMLGSNCLIKDMNAVQKLNELCNRYGVDTISGGAALSFAMEAYETGVITKEMTNGDEILWGDVDACIKLLKKITYREDIGNILAEGTRKAGKILGGIAPEMSVDVKGLELPAHDPRASYATGLQYATSTRGACHLNSLTSDLSLGGGTCGFGFMEPQEYNRFELGDKEIQLVNIHQNVMAMLDSLTCCKFLMFGLGADFLSTILDWINFTTGWDMTQKEFLESGERIFNLKRQYQVKCGITRKDDILPTRMTKRRLTGGSPDNIPDVNIVIDRYYEVRGWDIYGRPTQQLLERLGLDWFKIS